MEVRKRYPLVNMYQGLGDTRCYTTLTRASHSWFEWLSRSRQNKKLEIPSQTCFLERVYSSVSPIRKILGTPDESVVHCCPAKISPYNSWKSNMEHLKLPFPALLDSIMAAGNKSNGLPNTSLVREITQKLLNNAHLQHFCDLVAGLVNTVSAPHNTVMALNTLNMRKISECGSVSESSSVECGKLVSGFCEGKSTFANCSTNQGDSKNSMSVLNRTIPEITSISRFATVQKNNICKAESLVPLLCENVIDVGVDRCNSQYQATDQETVTMMNDACSSNFPAGEIRSGVKCKFTDVDKEMVSRKQRRINKHSKKRKRRMRKKEKSHSIKKASPGTKNEVPSSTSSQIKCSGGISKFTENKAVFHDWEESDDDFCIVFGDEVDSSCDIVPKSVKSQKYQSSIIKESSDLWIEFDSLTIVSGGSSASVDCRSYSSEISIQYDSDSDVEYETDCGQIFVDTEDFDSLSGLVFVSDNGTGCSVLPCQPYVHCPSFPSSTASCELVDDSAGIYEVNKRWKENTLHIDAKPRLPQRVTFAPEEKLVAVFPVDIIDRKSEWEQFALERFRFKRRIDEFEKIIAPYLTCAHREKIFRRMADMAS